MALDLTQFKLTSKYRSTSYMAALQTLLPTGNIWIFSIGTGLLASTLLFDKVLGTGYNTLQDLVGGVDTLQDETTVGKESTEITNSLWGNLLSCFASELSRVRADIIKLQNEAVPGLSEELLEDWERILGLPGECALVGDTQTIEERQEIAHLKFYGTFKTTTNSYLVEVAVGLGFTVIVNELEISNNSFRLGVVRMGNNRMGGAGAYAVLEITVIAGYTGDLAQLQCRFNKLKPAHTVIVWVLP